MTTLENNDRETLLLREIASPGCIHLTPLVVPIVDEVKALRIENEQLKQTNYVLRLKVDAIARKLFGRSSERLATEELQLVFDTLFKEIAPPVVEEEKPDALDSPSIEQEATEKKITASKKRRTLSDIIAGLPTRETIIVPDEVKANPEAWTNIGAAEETRLVDYIPARFECERIVRPKYVLKEDRTQAPITAPLPTLQPRCIATARLLAHTAVQHYEFHLPFYRIAHMYARLGMPLERQTIGGWMGMLHEACPLILAEIQREVFADGYVQIDETPIKYQDGERQGSCGTGYLWVVHNPVRNVSYFVWRTSRSTTSLHDIVPTTFRGIIQCDGYIAYQSFCSSTERAGSIELAGCMAHMRRKFFEAKDEGEDAQRILAQVQKLYRIEAQLREARAGPPEVLAQRQEQSQPLMDTIHERIQQLQASRKHLPQSLTGKALSYAHGQWAKLSVYLRDGRVMIDNNLVENAIRPSAIGKKNWLFMGERETGHRAATFYTLIANAHREGINAEVYLTDVFTRLPHETNQTVLQLTPKTWAAAQRAKKAAASALVTATVS